MSLQILDPGVHGELRLKKKSDFGFTCRQMIVPVWGQELPAAALHFPILFTRRGEVWIPVILLGLAEGENRFVSSKGEWLADFLPAALMAHPFYSVNGADGNPVLAIESEDSALTTDENSVEESWPLFDQAGEPTEITRRALKVLEQIRAQQEHTWSVMEQIEAAGLLKPWRPGSGEASKASSEFYVVDEAKLDSLSDEMFLAIRSKSTLALMYSHLFSLKHFRLTARKRSSLWLSASQKGISPLFSGEEEELFVFGED